MVQAAEREGQSVKDFLDEKSNLTRQVLDDCEISYTDFIRTTEKRHYTFVQSVLQKTYDNGDIYQGDYE
ncbi:class I tRNA ligase family protein [Patescibacteria group bacterium]|nr:class I tRNA ligase family protein [Patescibacteria group bacterium]